MKDMISTERQSSHLLGAITALVNWIVVNGVPDAVKSHFFGGRLIALKKKDGGIRPIVVGQTLRRLISKLINNYAKEKLATVFAPIQLGVGISGGVEAGVHAVRRYVEYLDADMTVIKLDFRNAFNTIRRDTILEAVVSAIPEVYSYVHAAYATTSQLV